MRQATAADEDEELQLNLDALRQALRRKGGGPRPGRAPAGHRNTSPGQ